MGTYLGTYDYVFPLYILYCSRSSQIIWREQVIYDRIYIIIMEWNKILDGFEYILNGYFLVSKEEQA